jgi:hypothetical protein
MTAAESSAAISEEPRMDIFDAGRLLARKLTRPGATSTQITGTNDHGVTVGYYSDAAGRVHGFFRDPSGAFTTIDAPGASLTLALGINNHNEIVGSRGDDARIRGFVLSNGKLTRIATAATVIISFAFDIDDRARIVGFYL